MEDREKLATTEEERKGGNPARVLLSSVVARVSAALDQATAQKSKLP